MEESRGTFNTLHKKVHLVWTFDNFGVERNEKIDELTRLDALNHDKRLLIILELICRSLLVGWAHKVHQNNGHVETNCKGQRDKLGLHCN